VRNFYQRHPHLGNLRRSGVGFSQLKRYGDGNLGGPTHPVASSSTFNVMPPPSIITTNLPTATPNYVYNTTLTATGGVQPLKWSLASGALPVGMSLNSAGTIYGTPTTGRHFHFHSQGDGFIGGAGWNALNATNV
jgi:hypothetical protein